MRERGPVRIKATRDYVEDPETAATLDIWVRLLAEAVRKRKPTRPSKPVDPSDPSAVLPE